MRFIIPAIYASVFAVAVYFAIVQSPLPQAVASVPQDSAAALTQMTSPKPGKRETCRQSVAAKQLKRHEARDQLQLCVAQARVECLKQAIDQKLRSTARRVFVKSCVAA
jgi:anti-sigma28 factor (negative regulator of flagellin synthesis)